MKKTAALLLTAITILGLTAASHTKAAKPPQNTDGVGPDRTNTGPSGIPDANGSQAANQTSPKNRMKGLSKAITKAPAQVADTVLKPIQDLNPGKSLGNFLSGINGIFESGVNANQTE